MIDKVEQRQRIQRYLLRQMSAAERVDFETQWAADDNLFDELLTVEDAMIGSYLRGECSEEEKQQITSQFMKLPQGRQKVEFARSWMDYAGWIRGTTPRPLAAPEMQKSAGPVHHPRSQNRYSAWAILQGGVLHARVGTVLFWLTALAGGSWVAMNNIHLRRQLTEMKVEQQALRSKEQQLRDQLETTATKLQQALRVESEQQQKITGLEEVSPGLPPFVLTARLTRGGDNQKILVIAPGTSFVRVQINLQYDDYLAYNVSLETPEGVQILRQENLQSRKLSRGQPAIILNLPTNGLQTQTYVLRVTAISDNDVASAVGDYSFRAIKR